jgi:hypothetical protein
MSWYSNLAALNRTGGEEFLTRFLIARQINTETQSTQRKPENQKKGERQKLKDLFLILF